MFALLPELPGAVGAGCAWHYLGKGGRQAGGARSGRPAPAGVNREIVEIQTRPSSLPSKEDVRYTPTP